MLVTACHSPSRQFPLGILTALLLASCPAPLPARAAEGPQEFDRSVAPLLAARCLGCHNPQDRQGGLDLTTAVGATKGGETGEVLVAGKPDESLLWERVSLNEMPPKKPLTGAEKAVLKKWVEGGAKWGTDPVDRFKYSSDARAGYDWWALQPVRRPEPPLAADPTWNQQAIDRFIAATLKANGLSPSVPAAREALIRRVTYDLTGLPPTPAEVAAYTTDEAPDSYERLVDRLLASPHYGERWGRHWLDIVRFGESQGFERDKLRPNAWPYRDWVISAFNEDLPYDEFVRLQLAGDVLAPNDPRAVTATGFLVCAAWDEVGHSQQSLAMRAVVRQDELEDIVGVTSQTFLGLTVNCARCHDHKFDPIRQTEYYKLCASLAGVRHGERERLSDLGRAQMSRKVETLQARVTELQQKLNELDEPHRALKLSQQAAVKAERKLPQPVARWEFEGDLRDSVGTLHGEATGKVRVDGGRLVLDGASYVATAPLPFDLQAKTLEVWVAVDSLTQRGGGAISVEALDGSVFDAVVFGEQEPARWMAGSNGFVRTSSFQGPTETQAAPELVQMALVYRDDRSIVAYRNGRPYGQPYMASGLQPFANGQAHVLFGLRHKPAGGNRYLTGSIDRAALYDRALTAEEVAALAGEPVNTITEDEVLADLTQPEREQRNALLLDLSAVSMQLRAVSAGGVYAAYSKSPEVTKLLDRGDTRLPKEVMPAGALSALQGLENYDLPEDASDATRRVTLAQWISNPANPLTARVMVNRLWHYHFGVGLVDSPNDFGFNGGRPSHPELLDWLASELMQPQAGAGEPRAWSLKHLQKLIVLSQTYRQASHLRPEAAKVDAGNRLLWRKSPQRLEAEELRDAMLAVSGELNPTMGGPGFQDFRTFNFNAQFYEMLDPVTFNCQRRTIYRTWVRSGRSEFLDVFDCPDPSTTAPKRAVTTTPLQALSLLNSSFVLRMSDRLAARVTKQGGQTEDQIGQVYRLLFSREPHVDELKRATDFAGAHGLPALCRVLFNSNEFLYVD